jgi:hypothetical protein
VSGRVQAALGNVVLELSPGPVSVRLEPAVQAYHAGAAAIALAARPDLPAADAAAAERVLALLSQLNPLALVPDGAQVEGLSNAALEVDARVDLSPLMAAQSGLTQLTALLPDFVRAEDIGAASIRSALQALDPAPLREQINVIFDRLGHRIVALKDIFFAAIDELGRVVDELLLPLSLGNLVSLADRLHAGLADQLLAFHPRRFKDEVTLIFDTVKRQLGAFDPGILIAELNQLRDQLLETLHGLVAGLLPDAAPFHELVDRVAGLKPSALLSPLVQTLAPISQLIASLDPHALFQPLIDAIARVRAQVPDVVAEVEAALDEVLDAIPDAASSGSVGASVSL